MNGVHLLFAWVGFLVGFLCFPFLFGFKRNDRAPKPEERDMWTKSGTWKT